MRGEIAKLSDCRSIEVRDAAFAYYPQLGRLAAFCKEHYHEDISLQQAANIVGLERTYFCNFFHQKVGVCFHCWLALLRIDDAKGRIRADNRSISSIAYAVGFNSLVTFERTFKRCTGITASQYKNQVRPC
jgi:AraC-like DNA-binding protein